MTVETLRDFSQDLQGEWQEPVFEPLTAEQMRQLLEKSPSVSPWQVIAGQAVVGLVVALAAWGLTGRQNVGWSAGYGALAVIIPAALFARGLMSRFSSFNAAAAGFGFFVWEAVKLMVGVAMVAAAPGLIADLSWLALLAGLFVTLKVYWFALLMRPKPNQI
jgi:ATP synthase protein I